MILTVTANPAYDVTYELAELNLGAVHRVGATSERAGGKGVNVAAVLTQLDVPAVATGFASAQFADDVGALGVGTCFELALPRVRRTVAVVEPGRTTSLWEPGVPLPDPDVNTDALCRRVEHLALQARAMVISGSLPPNADPDLVARLAARGRAARLPVVVDVSGAALALAASVGGVVLMPNNDELAELAAELGLSPTPPESVEDVVACSRALIGQGAKAVISTRGADGLIATNAEGSWQVRAPRHIEGNPTGAGDAAAAAVARGLADGLPLSEIAAAAVALSGAAVACPVAGRVDLEVLAELTPLVAAERITP